MTRTSKKNKKVPNTKGGIVVYSQLLHDERFTQCIDLPLYVTRLAERLGPNLHTGDSMESTVKTYRLNEPPDSQAIRKKAGHDKAKNGNCRYSSFGRNILAFEDFCVQSASLKVRMHAATHLGSSSSRKNCRY